MKEFIDKLTSRLEEKFKYNSEQAEIYRDGSDTDAYFREKKGLYLDRANTYGEIKRIVNQLAEEYNNESVKGDLISRSALIDWINKQREEVTKKQVAGSDGIFTREVLVTMIRCIGTFETFIKNQPTACNDGWIPYATGCKMPNEASRVWLSFTNPVTSYVKSAWYINGHFEWDNCRRVKETPMAWKPYEVPAPYQPKGE